MQDDKNVVTRLESDRGYEPVRADEYPDRIDLPVIIADGKFKGIISGRWINVNALSD